MSESSVGFKNISLLDAESFTKNGALVIQGNKIIYAGEDSLIPAAIKNNTAWSDGHGQWVTPGFINSHTHVAMSFMRDLAHDKPNMIEDFFFPIEKKLNAEDIYHFSFPSLVSGLKSGVTSFIDHYYHIEGVERALTELGARGFVAETLADLGGAKPLRLKNIESVVSPTSWSNSATQLIRRILGPHAMDTVSMDYMKEISEFSKQYQIPIHMHLSQTKNELKACLSKYKKTPVAVAQECNVLNEKTLAVHLITASDSDLKILQQSKVYTGLCPTSQILYEHIAPLKAFHQHSLKGVLGTDCAASHDSMDIMAEIKTLYLNYRQQGVSISPREVLKTVWNNPATWLSAPIGQLKKGFFADLVFFKRGLECEPMHDPHTQFIATLSSRHVEKVIVNGKTILEQKEIINLNEQNKAENIKKALGKYI